MARMGPDRLRRPGSRTEIGLAARYKISATLCGRRVSANMQQLMHSDLCHVLACGSARYPLLVGLASLRRASPHTRHPSQGWSVPSVAQCRKRRSDTRRTAPISGSANTLDRPLSVYTSTRAAGGHERMVVAKRTPRVGHLHCRTRPIRLACSTYNP